MYLGCTRCFRHFTFPSTWMAVEPYAAPPSPSPRTPTRAWTLTQTRRRSSSRKLSEGWIAQVPRALTRFPPCLKAKRQGERAQVPRALIRPPRHPYLGDTGAEGPEISPRASQGLTGSAPGGQPDRWTHRCHTAYVEGGPPQRPARPLVLAADAIRPLGMASILLPSAAEGSCPVELGNPPILALILCGVKDAPFCD